jgi:hypothetical protein
LSTITQIKQENAEREYNDTKINKLFCLISFSFSFAFFLCISGDKQEKKSEEYCSFKVRRCFSASPKMNKKRKVRSIVALK